jgi:hypothetical protein
MANAAAEPRADGPTPDSGDDFEFCILSSGSIVPAGKGAGAGADMCVADELFWQGKLLPLRPSSAADGATLPRSESAASTVGRVSRSGSRSASSSGSSSGCVSRSQSSKSEQGAPRRRSLSSSVFYAHPSPSPQLRWARPRRSTGSAQPGAAWGLFRLGVAGAPDVYPPPPPPRPGGGDARGGRSARFEQVATAVDRKVGLGQLALFGDSLGCKCSPDVVEPAAARTAEAAKRSRKIGGAKSGQGVARRSRILDWLWLQELSIVKDKK